jgi:hypothetical protein
LTTAIGDPNDREKFFGVRASSETHPATALLSDFQRLDLDRARIYRRHQFDAVGGNDVSVLLEVQHDDPVVVERKLDRGRVLVQSIPLGISWSTLPLCQAYVAMMHEWLWYLAEPALPKRNLAVGEAVIESANPKGSAELTLPDRPHPRASACRLPRRYGVPLCRDAITRRICVALEGERGRCLDGEVPRAAQSRRVGPENPFRRRTCNSFARLKVFKSTPILTRSRSAERSWCRKHPLEGWLLPALAFALLGELMLAGWLTQRRNLRLKPVAMAG